MPIERREVSIAGSDASDDRVDMATAWGAIRPRAKTPSRMRACQYRQRIGSEGNEDSDKGDDHDIMAQPGEGRAARRRSY